MLSTRRRDWAVYLTAMGLVSCLLLAVPAEKLIAHPLFVDVVVPFVICLGIATVLMHLSLKRMSHSGNPLWVVPLVLSVVLCIMYLFPHGIRYIHSVHYGAAYHQGCDLGRIVAGECTTPTFDPHGPLPPRPE